MNNYDIILIQVKKIGAILMNLEKGNDNITNGDKIKDELFLDNKKLVENNEDIAEKIKLLQKETDLSENSEKHKKIENSSSVLRIIICMGIFFVVIIIVYIAFFSPEIGGSNIVYKTDDYSEEEPYYDYEEEYEEDGEEYEEDIYSDSSEDSKSASNNKVKTASSKKASSSKTASSKKASSSKTSSSKKASSSKTASSKKASSSKTDSSKIASSKPPVSHEEKSNTNEKKTKIININTANASELAKYLPGVGEVTAELIIEYRETYGLFKSVDELILIKGIGEKKMEQLRPYVMVDDNDIEEKNENIESTEYEIILGQETSRLNDNLFESGNQESYEMMD